jgi:hypothetical protein
MIHLLQIFTSHKLLFFCVGSKTPQTNDTNRVKIVQNKDHVNLIEVIEALKQDDVHEVIYLTSIRHVLV